MVGCISCNQVKQRVKQAKTTHLLVWDISLFTREPEVQGFSSATIKCNVLLTLPGEGASRPTALVFSSEPFHETQ